MFLEAGRRQCASLIITRGRALPTALGPSALPRLVAPSSGSHASPDPPLPTRMRRATLTGRPDRLANQIQRPIDPLGRLRHRAWCPRTQRSFRHATSYPQLSLPPQNTRTSGTVRLGVGLPLIWLTPGVESCSGRVCGCDQCFILDRGEPASRSHLGFLTTETGLSASSVEPLPS